MIFLFLMACYSSHQVLSLADYNTAQQRKQNANLAARIGGKVPSNPQSNRFIRAYAFESIGKLKIVNPEVIAACKKALLSPKNAPFVRAHAAWAIGELGRDLGWEDQAKNLHQILVAALNTALDDETAYYVVEALGKIYIPHEHTIAEDLSTVRALNTLAANHPSKLPAIFHIVKFRIETMEVLIVLLKESIEQAQKDNNLVVNAYGASLDVMRFLESHRVQLAGDFDKYQEGIQQAFESIKAGLSLRQRSLSLMSIWYLGRAIDDPRIIELIAKELTSLDVSQDPGLRLILQTTLAKMSQNQSIRSHLRKSVLPTSTDANQLAVLLGIQKGERDLLQQLYGVDVKSQPGNRK